MDVLRNTTTARGVHAAAIQHAEDELQDPKKVFKTLPAYPFFPTGVSTYSCINEDPNTFYVDKTHYIPKLESLDSVVFMLAPKRFGKSLFLDTLACYYDISRAILFEKDFGKRWIGQADELERGGMKKMIPRKTALANKFYVLRLDFSTITNAWSFEDFNQKLNFCINLSIREFCQKYPEVEEPSMPNKPPFELLEDASASFLRLFKLYLNPKSMPLLIIIDEYDSFFRSITGCQHLIRDPEDLKMMEVTFKAFFTNIKACLCENLRVLIAGVVPMDLSTHGRGFNVGMHTLQDEIFAALFGFTDDDVKGGLELLKLGSIERQQIFDHFKAVYNGYRFRDPALTVFNPMCIQYCFKQIALHLSCHPDATVDSVQELLKRVPDPHYKPIGTNLSLLSSYPYSFNIILNCINKPKGFLTSLDAMHFGFRPTAFVDLQRQSYNAIISWMFFTGALTFATLPGPKLSFKAPNLIARQEYFEEYNSA